MNFFAVIENIKLILKKNHHESIAQELLELQLAGGTGGEVLISVCSKLIEIRKTLPNVYRIISKDAEELINYAKSIDLYP